jgi:hypothetical protein
VSEREEWMTLIRNEYDPMPDLGKGNYKAFEDSWDDGAGRIADAILADKTLLSRKHADELRGLQNVGSDPLVSDESTQDVRWAVNVLLEKIAAKFEALETMDLWRSEAAETVRSFKHDFAPHSHS